MLRYGAIDSAPNHLALDLRTRAAVETKDFCLGRKLPETPENSRPKDSKRASEAQWILNIKKVSERFQFCTSKRSIEG